MSQELDLLSDMPDVILQHILSFLPTRESARTSVLSRRWLHLWRFVPTLHFETDGHPTPRSRHEQICASSELADGIDQFLALRDPVSPLLRFHLRVRFEFLHQRHPLLDWISYAKSHGVRDMVLRVPLFDLPHSLSTFGRLHESPELLLGSLFTLYTIPIEIAESDLKALTLRLPCPLNAGQGLSFPLSSCPALQELTLYRRQHAAAVKIIAPDLRRLTIIDKGCHSYGCLPPIEITCPRLEFFHLTNWADLNHFEGNMPSLIEASIDLSCSWVKLGRPFQLLFMSICNVKKLTFKLELNPWSFIDRTSRFPIFHNLKFLEFKSCLKENYIKEVLLDFLSCCPNLSSLHLIDKPEICYSSDCGMKVHLPGIAEGIISKPQYHSSALETSHLLKTHHLKLVSVKRIRDQELRSDVLKMLSTHMREWHNVVVIQ